MHRAHLKQKEIFDKQNPIRTHSSLCYIKINLSSFPNTENDFSYRNFKVGSLYFIYKLNLKPPVFNPRKRILLSILI